MASHPSYAVDVALVGGGLQNGLIALALAEQQPEISVALIEREDALGGNHTWCFHAGDVPKGLASVVEEISVYRWGGYEVQFPNLTRQLDERYSGTTSEALASAVERSMQRKNAELILGCGASAVAADHVVTEDGQRIDATLVIDARGPEAYVDRSGAGFQKFVGVELELDQPHGLSQPVLMDATVEQVGGFRFFYILPLAERRVLVEDTTFGRSPDIDLSLGAKECLRYARSKGLLVKETIRTEHGSLAMPWAGQHERPTAPLRAGYQGGWFHPATGYSFPVAARLAEFIASRSPDAVIGPELDALWAEQMRQVRFCHRLNRMLFAWFHEGDEWNVFERFYRLPVGLIRRFYSLQTSALDRTRLLVGRPPRGFSLRARLASREAR